MRPEDHIADKRRPYTGAEYIESLKDGREVYIDGERIADITVHPAYRNSVRSMARLYDALHDENPSGRYAYLEPEEKKRIYEILKETHPEARSRFETIARSRG